MLATALNQLMTMSPLPPLFMRIIIQVLQSMPGLQRFVMDLLGRLISRQFWADKNLWQGFCLLAEKAGGWPGECFVVLRSAV